MTLALLILSAVVVFGLSAAVVVHRWLLIYRARRNGQ